jgi:hypothetical protein
VVVVRSAGATPSRPRDARWDVAELIVTAPIQIAAGKFLAIAEAFRNIRELSMRLRDCGADAQQLEETMGTLKLGRAIAAGLIGTAVMTMLMLAARMIYARFFAARLPGPVAARGAVYGFAVFLVAQLVVTPMMGGGVFSGGNISMIMGSLLGTSCTAGWWGPGTVIQSRRPHRRHNEHRGTPICGLSWKTPLWMSCSGPTSR